jgi:hypothetical protein
VEGSDLSALPDFYHKGTVLHSIQHTMGTAVTITHWVIQ